MREVVEGSHGRWVIVENSSDAISILCRVDADENVIDWAHGIDWNHEPPSMVWRAGS